MEIQPCSFYRGYCFFVLCWCLLLFQPVLKAQDVLNGYIQEGLARNLVLQQKNVSLDKAELALKTAKSMYLPSIGFEGGYQTATGGRQIPLPIGDMLNPVYSTLNTLTNSSVFPQIANQTIAFLPKDFYDAKIRTSVPVLNIDIGFNKKLSEQKVKLQTFELDAYRRALIKDIKTAYFNYLKSLQAIQIYESAVAFAIEGKRVNEKLVANGKGLPAYVLRANSEIASGKAELLKAQQQTVNARLYFNVLLNRDAEAKIDTVYDVSKTLSAATLLAKETSVQSGREELKSLDQMVRVSETLVEMNKRYAVPKLNAFVDVGSQAEHWKFNDQSRYYMAGLQLSIPIYAGGRNQQKIRQASLDLQDATLNQQYMKQQLDLSSRVALNDLKSAFGTYQSAQEQFVAAAAYKRLIERGYNAGSNTYIETIDARNQYTSSSLALSISKYNVLQAVAALELETASFQLTE